MTRKMGIRQTLNSATSHIHMGLDMMSCSRIVSMQIAVLSRCKSRRKCRINECFSLVDFSCDRRHDSRKTFCRRTLRSSYGVSGLVKGNRHFNASINFTELFVPADIQKILSESLPVTDHECHPCVRPSMAIESPPAAVQGRLEAGELKINPCVLATKLYEQCHHLLKVICSQILQI